jgi:hypothetical protein
MVLAYLPGTHCETGVGAGVGSVLPPPLASVGVVPAMASVAVAAGAVSVAAAGAVVFVAAAAGVSVAAAAAVVLVGAAAGTLVAVGSAPQPTSKSMGISKTPISSLRVCPSFAIILSIPPLDTTCRVAQHPAVAGPRNRRRAACARWNPVDPRSIS